MVSYYLLSKEKVSETKSAGMAELADALDLGSSGKTVQVQVLLPAPKSRKRICQDRTWYMRFSLVLWGLFAIFKC